MLRAYKHNENHILCEVPLEQLEKGSWINCAAPDTAELNKLSELTGIPVDSLQTALDREERSTWNWKTTTSSSLSIRR